MGKKLMLITSQDLRFVMKPKICYETVLNVALLNFYFYLLLFLSNFTSTTF